MSIKPRTPKQGTLGTAVGGVLLTVLLLAHPHCVPVEDDADGGGGGADVGQPDAGDPGSWPPDIGSASDNFTLNPEGGRFELFGGELVLLIDQGAVDTGTALAVQRTIVNVRGTDLVGYVWGPHLPSPIDLPAASQIIVTVPGAWIPEHADGARAATLYYYDGGDPRPLDGGSAHLEFDDVVIEANLGTLGTDIVIGHEDL